MFLFEFFRAHRRDANLPYKRHHRNQHRLSSYWLLKTFLRNFYSKFDKTFFHVNLQVINHNLELGSCKINIRKDVQQLMSAPV